MLALIALPVFAVEFFVLSNYKSIGVGVHFGFSVCSECALSFVFASAVGWKN